MPITCMFQGCMRTCDSERPGLHACTPCGTGYRLHYRSLLNVARLGPDVFCSGGRMYRPTISCILLRKNVHHRQNKTHEWPHGDEGSNMYSCSMALGLLGHMPDRMMLCERYDGPRPQSFVLTKSNSQPQSTNVPTPCRVDVVPSENKGR